MDSDRTGLEILSRADCLGLLATRRVGRVAATYGALPVILPVPYRLLDDDVIFVTDTGSRARTSTYEAVIAFEVDDLDPLSRTGWSVLALGMGRRVSEDDPMWPGVVALGLQPWEQHQAGSMIRLRTDRLSGRRLAIERLPAEPLQEVNVSE